jgi:probable addiction module antidote protein
MNKKFKDPWEEFEVESYVKNKNLAKLCLENEIEEYKKTGDITYVKQQLKTVAKAYGWSNLERDTGITRMSLYSMLNGKTEPRLKNFLNILNILGFKLSIEPIRT